MVSKRVAFLAQIYSIKAKHVLILTSVCRKLQCIETHLNVLQIETRLNYYESLCHWISHVACPVAVLSTRGVKVCLKMITASLNMCVRPTKLMKISCDEHSFDSQY